MSMWTRVGDTLELILNALLPVAGEGATAGGEGACSAVGEVRSCLPRQIRSGMGPLLDPGGDFRAFFPGCLAIGAPFVLFRLKRQGYSDCSVRAAREGLYVRGRR